VNVGIGLPNAVPGTEGPLLKEWVGAVERARFTSLGVVDRVSYDSYEPLAALAAAAGATHSVRLATMITIAPLRNTALLAKQAATLDRLSGGRFVLGLGLGARREDYTAAGVDYSDRGARFDEQLVELRRLWRDGRVGPRPTEPDGPPLLIGGTSEQAYARAARSADGYVHGGGPPRTFTRAAERVRVAWRDVGRGGQPLLWAQGYFAFGAVVRAGMEYMRDYYSFTGPFAERIAAGLLTTPQKVVQFARGYEEAGCDELVLFPAVPDVRQVELLAEALWPGRAGRG
jgi:alkanesulfonate monooxygenase SsuD/methylene tetrahydromethanopterin reductase-like flavin-dependent oxidoreductase (luciferase family)